MVKKKFKLLVGIYHMQNRVVVKRIYQDGTSSKVCEFSVEEAAEILQKHHFDNLQEKILNDGTV